MPNTTERVRYIIEVDDSGAASIKKMFVDAANAATAQIQQIFSSAGTVRGGFGTPALPAIAVGAAPTAAAAVAAATGGGLGSPQNVPQLLAMIYGRIGDATRELSGRLYDITLAVRAAAQGTGTANPPSPPSPRSTGGGISRFQISRIAAIGGMVSGNPAGVIASTGVLIGGATGAEIAGIGAVAAAAMGAAETLRNFDAALGASMAQWDMFMIGFKMQLAHDLSGPLSQIMGSFEKLLIQMEPTIVDFAKLAADVLPSVLEGLGKLAQGLHIAVDAIEVAAAWMNQKTGGGGNVTWQLLHPGLSQDLQFRANQLDQITDLSAKLRTHELTLPEYQKLFDQVGLRQLPADSQIDRKALHEALAKARSGGDIGQLRDVVMAGTPYPSFKTGGELQKDLTNALDQLKSDVKNISKNTDDMVEEAKRRAGIRMHALFDAISAYAHGGALSTGLQGRIGPAGITPDNGPPRLGQIGWAGVQAATNIPMPPPNVIAAAAGAAGASGGTSMAPGALGAMLSRINYLLGGGEGGEWTVGGQDPTTHKLIRSFSFPQGVGNELHSRADQLAAMWHSITDALKTMPMNREYSQMQGMTHNIAGGLMNLEHTGILPKEGLGWWDPNAMENQIVRNAAAAYDARHGRNASAMSHTQQYVLQHGGGDGHPAAAWPLPQNATIHAPLNYSPQITVAEENRVFAAIQDAKIDVMRKINDGRDSRWHRLQYMRMCMLGLHV